MRTKLAFLVALLTAWLFPAMAAHAAPVQSTSRAVAHQSAIDPKSLQLPTSAFGSLQILNNGPTDATFADIYDPHHTKSYSQLGLVSAYEEDGYTKLPTGDEVHLQYVGGIFPTADAAKAEVEDARAYFTGAGGTQYIKPCSSTPFTVDGISLTYPAECLRFFATINYKSGDKQALGYYNFSIGACTAAVRLTNPTTLTNDQFAPLGQAGTAVMHAAVAALTAACGTSTPTPQVSVQISGIGLAHQVKGKVKMTHVVKTGETALFVATYKITAGATATATMTINKGAKTLGTLDMRGDTLKDGTPYFYYATSFGKQYIGKFQATITITSGSATDSRSISFQVKKGK